MIITVEEIAIIIGALAITILIQSTLKFLTHKTTRRVITS